MIYKYNPKDVTEMKYYPIIITLHEFENKEELAQHIFRLTKNLQNRIKQKALWILKTRGKKLTSQT